MRQLFLVVAYESNGERNVLTYFDDFDKAENYYFMCVESSERDDHREYVIETKN